MKVKRLIVTLCIALFMAFPAVSVEARPKCPKVWIEGHHNQYGKWVKGHWKRQKWVRGHYKKNGEWAPGHCRPR